MKNLSITRMDPTLHILYPLVPIKVAISTKNELFQTQSLLYFVYVRADLIKPSDRRKPFQQQQWSLSFKKWKNVINNAVLNLYYDCLNTAILFMH